MLNWCFSSYKLPFIFAVIGNRLVSYLVNYRFSQIHNLENGSKYQNGNKLYFGLEKFIFNSTYISWLWICRFIV